MSLFKKALLFTDIHFGLKSNSLVHNQDCEAFVEWAIKLAKEQGCETGFFLGDWHHHRASLNLQTLNFSLRSLERLSKAFDKFYFIPGNHDLYYRDKRDIHGAEWARHIPNIEIINDWFEDSGVVIAPWLVGDDHKRIPKLRAQYVFGHFELPTFYMNSSVQMPDHGEISLEQFQNYELGFSGHFHKRQSKNNMHYIGNAFPHNYADNWDDDRGMMILEWGGVPEYYTWDKQPTFRTVSLSQLIDDADKILKPKQHLRVTLDIDISFEEASFIKEKYINEYQLRELTLIAEKKVSEINTDIDIKSFESIDTIVSNQIINIDSETYNKNTLLSIYSNL